MLSSSLDLHARNCLHQSRSRRRVVQFLAWGMQAAFTFVKMQYRPHVPIVHETHDAPPCGVRHVIRLHWVDCVATEELSHCSQH